MRGIKKTSDCQSQIYVLHNYQKKLSCFFLNFFLQRSHACSLQSFQLGGGKEEGEEGGEEEKEEEEEETVVVAAAEQAVISACNLAGQCNRKLEFIKILSSLQHNQQNALARMF